MKLGHLMTFVFDGPGGYELALNSYQAFLLFVGHVYCDKVTHTLLSAGSTHKNTRCTPAI